jgi:hypothetical protein
MHSPHDKLHFKLTVDGTIVTCTTDENNLYLHFKGNDAHNRGSSIYMLLSYILSNNGYDMKSNNVQPSPHGETLRLTPFVANYWENVKPINIVAEVELVIRQLKSAAEHIDPFIGKSYGFAHAVQQIQTLNPKAPEEIVPATNGKHIIVPAATLRTAIGLGLVNAYVDRYTEHGAADLLPISRSIMNTLAFTQMAKDVQAPGEALKKSKLSEHEIRTSIRKGLTAGLKAAGVKDVACVETIAIKSVYDEIRRAKDILGRQAREQE